jgi:hypothetical protein
LPAQRPLALLFALDALAGAWLVYLLFAFSNAGVGAVPTLVAAVGGALLAAAWVLVVVARRRGASPRSMRLAAGAVPAACRIVGGLFLFGKPPHNTLFRLRFAGSREALTEQADGVLIESPPPVPRRVGLFRVTGEVHGRQVWFLVDGCADGHRCGIVYAPGSRPPVLALHTFTRLGGPWYHVDERLPRM